MKYCSIDIETTGLDNEIHQLLEFGCVIDDLENPLPAEELPRFQCYFPTNVFTCSAVAAVMNTEIIRRIGEADREKYNFINANKFGARFKEFLIKNGFEQKKQKVTINAAGKNFSGFDGPFMSKHTDIDKHVKYRHRVLDPGILYMNKTDDAVPNMGECKIRAGLSEFVAHNAIDDAIDVIHLIRHHFLG